MAGFKGKDLNHPRIQVIESHQGALRTLYSREVDEEMGKVGFSGVYIIYSCIIAGWLCKSLLLLLPSGRKLVFFRLCILALSALLYYPSLPTWVIPRYLIQADGAEDRKLVFIGFTFLTISPSHLSSIVFKQLILFAGMSLKRKQNIVAASSPLE